MNNLNGKDCTYLAVQALDNLPTTFSLPDAQTKWLKYVNIMIKEHSN